MKKYTVEGLVTVSCFTKVQAESEEEAIKIAKDRELATFHIDRLYSKDEYFHFFDDGIPFDLKIDKG